MSTEVLERERETEREEIRREKKNQRNNSIKFPRPEIFSELERP